MNVTGSFRLLIYMVILAVLLLSVGCYMPTETDIERLNILESTYGDKFQFKLEDQFYLKVRMKYETEIDEEELEDIYLVFFFDDGGKRRDTSYVYLNFYNLKDKFQYQIVYSFTKNRLVKTNGEYY